MASQWGFATSFGGLVERGVHCCGAIICMVTISLVVQSGFLWFSSAQFRSVLRTRVAFPQSGVGYISKIEVVSRDKLGICKHSGRIPVQCVLASWCTSEFFDTGKFMCGGFCVVALERQEVESEGSY